MNPAASATGLTFQSPTDPTGATTDTAKTAGTYSIESEDQDADEGVRDVDLLRFGQGDPAVTKRLGAAAVGAIAVATAATAGEPVRWERLFVADGAPALHAKARYHDAQGKEHRLELWRSGRALRRDTDEKLSMIVERRAGGDDEYHVVQRGEGGRAYDVSRDALNRIGNFPEWTQLATLLTRPHGEVRVEAGGQGKTAAGACRWYEATADKARERICWSSGLKLPLVVERWDSGSWAAVVEVEEVKLGKVQDGVFHPRVDVARVDIDHDLD